MMIKQRGQSLVEVIFSVGILVVVIMAVVSLMVKTTGIKTMELQRKKAVEMSEVIVENLLENKKNDPDDFWRPDKVIKDVTIVGYDGYLYSVNMDSDNLGENDSCNSETKCVNAIITISWGNGQTLTVKRFFSDKLM